jgi:hypothetical protein
VDVLLMQRNEKKNNKQSQICTHAGFVKIKLGIKILPAKIFL